MPEPTCMIGLALCAQELSNLIFLMGFVLVLQMGPFSSKSEDLLGYTPLHIACYNGKLLYMNK